MYVYYTTNVHINEKSANLFVFVEKSWELFIFLKKVVVVVVYTDAKRHLTFMC